MIRYSPLHRLRVKQRRRREGPGPIDKKSAERSDRHFRTDGAFGSGFVRRKVLGDAGEPTEAEERARKEDIRDGVDAKARATVENQDDCIL